MLKPNFLNILFYLFLKYFLAYIIFMVATKNYAILKLNNIKTVEDFFYYAWLILFIPILNAVLFSFPYYLSFKLKEGVLFFSSIAIILFFEYLLYVYFNSQKHIDTNGLVIVLISIIVFTMFFFKKIRKYIFKKS